MQCYIQRRRYVLCVPSSLGSIPFSISRRGTFRAFVFRLALRLKEVFQPFDFLDHTGRNGH
jgi:hypothetical protein